MYFFYINMNNLIDTIKKIENILYSLERILKQECHNLLKSKTSNEEILELIKRKKILFKKLIILSQDRLCLEKEYNIFPPYESNNKLNNYWKKIINTCLILRKLNLKNKIIMNKKFYLNQRFLELSSSYKKSIIYNLDGNLEI
ncbi:flagellar protein FlgN [Buchnera aphidicola]|nr:flagella synthesis protein FlgN [Buchnera aphidicola]OQX98260.1 MAG: flagellar biosynthesis protein FlgN [Erwiniaceae bacterium 4572_131]